MIQDRPVVTGIYVRPIDAARALRGLDARGFAPDDVSVILPQGRDLERELAARGPSESAATALGVGVSAALVAGLTAVGALATGGAAVLVAGPLGGAVAALASTGKALGLGLVGAMTAHGIPNHDAELFAREIGCGKLLVAVRHTDRDRLDTAERVLANAGAETTSRA